MNRTILVVSITLFTLGMASITSVTLPRSYTIASEAVKSCDTSNITGSRVDCGGVALITAPIMAHVGAWVLWVLYARKLLSEEPEKSAAGEMA